MNLLDEIKEDEKKENRTAANPGSAEADSWPESELRGKKSSTVKKTSETLKRPLIVSGVLLVVLLALYFAGTVYMNGLNRGTGESLEAGNTVSGETISGENEFSGALNEEDAQEELLMRLMEEYENGVKDGEKNILEQLRLGLEDSTSVKIETLRSLYKEQLVVASGGKYHFIPLNDSMKKNDYLEENLNILESGELQYLKNGEVSSYKGIDVSKFQGKIDWSQVAQDGVTFAFIRVGYRGYGTKGTLVTDDTAEANIKGANEAGIKTGVYFYTQAITEAEILEEAQLVLDLIRPYRIDCPVVIDVERTDAADGRMNALGVQERTQLVKLFCETIEAAGYRPMVYHNLEMGAVMLDVEQLEEFDKWFAYYKIEMYYPYAYKVWQYSDKGRVRGISGDVDLDIAFEPLWQE